MEELRLEFLHQAISNLQTAQTSFVGKEILSKDFIRLFFRQLHTIKGTSLTFGFEHLSQFAHETENLLQILLNKGIENSLEAAALLPTSINSLLEIAENYLLGRETKIPQQLVNEIRSLAQNELTTSTELLFHQIPNNFLTQLTAQEKKNLGVSLEKGNFFYLIEIFFSFLNFDLEFKQVKQILCEKGEVIAVAPAPTAKTGSGIGFQIFFAGNLNHHELTKLLVDYHYSIVFENSPVTLKSANNIEGLLANLVADGKKVAQILDKKVNFQTSFTKIALTPKTLILINEIASHLIHNAIDHGIETGVERVTFGKSPTSQIEIRLTLIDEYLLLQIKDDGKGIDLKKINALANEKSLIPLNQPLDEKQTIEILFSQGFTTSKTVTEISGRGVGLDAVKGLVENAGGKIEVETAIGKGSTFSISLPKI